MRFPIQRSLAHRPAYLSILDDERVPAGILHALTALVSLNSGSITSPTLKLCIPNGFGARPVMERGLQSWPKWSRTQVCSSLIDGDLRWQFTTQDESATSNAAAPWASAHAWRPRAVARSSTVVVALVGRSAASKEPLVDLAIDCWYGLRL